MNFYKYLFLILLITGEIFSQTNLTIREVDSINALSFSYRGISPIKTIELANEAYNASTKLNYDLGRMRALSFLGVGYRNIGDYDAALKHYLRASEIADSVEDKEQKAYSLNNIGNIFFRQKKDSLALIPLHDALEIAVNINDSSIIAYCYINLGRVYSALNEFDSSITYLNKAASVRKKTNDLHGFANTLNELGRVYSLNDQLENSYLAYNKALTTLKQDKEIHDIISEAYMGLASYYSKKGDTYLSNKYVKKAIELNNKLKRNDMLLENYQLEKENFIKQGNYKRAYEALSEYSNIKDSLVTVTTKKSIADLEYKYRSREKERENKHLQSENDLKQQKIEEQNFTNKLLIALIIIIVFALFITIIFYRYNKVLNNQLKERNTKIEFQKEELVKLNATKDRFFSIISHDLKSPFTGIIGSISMLKEIYHDLSEEDRITTIEQMYNSTKKIQTLLIALLDWARTQTGEYSFTPEVLQLSKIVENVFGLYEHSAKAKDISLQETDLSAKEVFADEKMISTLLRNLVGNAIKFTPIGGEIKLRSYIENKSTIIEVTDNGVGIPEKHLQKLFKIDESISTDGTNNESGTGLGLILCKELMEKHNGKIEVESELDKGTTFRLYFPSN